MAQRKQRRTSALVATGAVVGTSLVGLAIASPAGAATSYSSNQFVLSVSGNDRDNTIVVGRDVAGDIQVNGRTAHVFGRVATVTNVRLIKVFGRGGNDTISIDETNGVLPQPDLFGGSGDDHLTGGSANDLLSGDAGNDTLIGGSGNETLLGGSGNDFVDGNGGADVALLGDGDDLFQWDPGDGSDVVEGQAGHDEMLFNGSNGGEIFDVSANGSRVRFTRSLGTITMDLNSVENITTTAKGGADAFTVHDLTGTGVTDVNIDESAAANGVADGAADRVTVTGTNNADVIKVAGTSASGVTVSGLSAAVHITSTDSTDGLNINAADGDDIVDAHALVSGVVAFSADGGNGADLLVGSQGDDTLTGGAGDDILIGGPGVDQLDGGSGTNVLVQ